jgi:3-hydroxybutyrate dehydrogenase
MHPDRLSRGVPLRALAGRVALVTGSTSGIGLGIARALAGAGATIILHGIATPEEVARLREAITEDFGVVTDYAGADLLDPAAAAGLVDGVLHGHGRLDVLVNNAGIQHVAPVNEFPPAAWDRVIAINLTAAFHATRRVLPAMRDNGFGRVVNIASAHGLVASPFKSAYVAAKHGLIGLTRTVALEMAEPPITCNAVCPGYVATPLVERQIAEQGKAHGIPREQVVRDVLLAQQPNKRFAGVEEVGALVAFLASEAAASITGAARITAEGVELRDGGMLDSEAMIATIGTRSNPLARQQPGGGHPLSARLIRSGSPVNPASHTLPPWKRAATLPGGGAMPAIPPAKASASSCGA